MNGILVLLGTALSVLGRLHFALIAGEARLILTGSEKNRNGGSWLLNHIQYRLSTVVT